MSHPDEINCVEFSSTDDEQYLTSYRDTGMPDGGIGREDRPVRNPRDRISPCR